MKQKRINGLFIFIFIVCFAFSSGCTSALRNSQLEKVAKDWALVIRASQVIPVYPLTEDLQPGDVLLVSTPIEEQARLYKKNGFLPLDQHLVRLDSAGFRDVYSSFYNARYGIDSRNVPPGKWQTVDAGGKSGWETAPHAAFPTYQFSVETGSGLNLAIPIQGVPFALGLMGSGKASGTVTIADAYTFGLDIYSLKAMMDDWAMRNRSILRSYVPHDENRHFLRVVSRVYVTGRMNVTINNDDSKGASLAGGADRPVNLYGVKEGAAVDDYNAAIKAINDVVTSNLPGGKIKIASATSRSVTLSETFSRPLVIGYIGFDMPILEGGRLGAPISTLSQLNLTPQIEAISSGRVEEFRLAALTHMYQALREIKGKDADDIRSRLDALDRLLPREYPYSLYTLKSPGEIQKDSKIIAGSKIGEKGFRAVLAYIGQAQTTVETLSDIPQARTDPALSSELQAAQAELQTIGARLYTEPVLQEAIDFVFFGRSNIQGGS